MAKRHATTADVPKDRPAQHKGMMEVLQRDNHAQTSGHRGIVILAALSMCLYGLISWLSWRFDVDSVTTERPIIAALALFAIAFVAYLGVIRLAWRAPQSRQLVMLIVSTAVVFRVVMLFSLPIQEVDIYRYLWDGAASTAGVSPFRYSPLQVQSADLNTVDDEQLGRLVQLRDRHPALAEVLKRVHFAELPTIYPPTSQVVFAASSLTTPSGSGLLTRLFIMKAWFIGFDMATLFVVIALLRLLNKPVGLCAIYAWCPLLMKEVANSGHLDAIAVFLTTLSVYLVTRFLVKKMDSLDRWATIIQPALIAMVLGSAVGAKLFPVILVPLIALAVARKTGWQFVFVPAAVFAVTTAALLSYMMPGEKPDDDPSRGVATFLRHWEMNDFIFLTIIENLKPTADRGPHEIAWFTVMPESARQAVVGLAMRFNLPPPEAPFLVARALTAIAFMVTALVIAWRMARPENAGRFCEGAFLTLAWFWLLCPTQNPWYWTWALPLLPFARSRVWLAMSGLVLVYYLRFWLSYHFAETAVLGTPYTGVAFYDFVVTWMEFAPWLACLLVSYLLYRRKTDTVGIATYH
jgi:hypothetical protein